ncbi:BsuBI/PstI family type II restriction endonuclease [Nordella sp. HKS 07]|uniref:BsuBI/PstI family type II restriction endonuclease n=1 Tax=Nordella sp. HKS 07 TaxID=2712222 RepID=UPI00210F9551|nr:BsuBI/PstI family type II restriction endonuclease [Nordella sp. HKS 07]
MTDAADFDRKQIAFLTAYQDRQSAGFKKTVAQLAWGSFAWFVSEPKQLLVLHDGTADVSHLASLPRGITSL